MIVRGLFWGDDGFRRSANPRAAVQEAHRAHHPIRLGEWPTPGELFAERVALHRRTDGGQRA